MSALTKKGSTRPWRRKRLVVLERDWYQCKIKTPSICTTYATHVDHIHGKTQCNGCATDQLDHLQAACQSCNLKKGKPTNAPIALTANNYR